MSLLTHESMEPSFEKQRSIYDQYLSASHELEEDDLIELSPNKRVCDPIELLTRVGIAKYQTC
jgi:hypothetical protein